MPYPPLFGILYDIWNVGTQYRMESDPLTSGYGISPSSALSALQGSQVTSMIITVLLLSVTYLILTLSQSHNNVIRNHWAKYFRNIFCLVIGGYGYPVKINFENTLSCVISLWSSAEIELICRGYKSNTIHSINFEHASQL